ncbi:MAG: polysaccharide biosynthesis/export family protein [Micavibrio aeruginosavorus]|uniref:Polysaccharide biosynthesis/export family protein n=1 Tax=Micavibrio aeruginosavorus TaxID=349221 RepID=A0A2W5FJ45_9BACT|nr:MAG: polysaccharide biosynthesis/export family protein [Micavibrio aeruginosavorus]
MRDRGIFITALLATAILGGTSGYSQDNLVMNDIAPFVGEDISIEPRLLTVKDVEQELKKKPSFIKSKNDISEEISPLEQMYSARIVADVQQFGYEMFGSKSRPQNSLSRGAAQDNLILSIGDEISVVMRGQKQDSQTTGITSEGMLVIEGLPPIPAAGRMLGDVRAQVKSEVSKLYNTDVFLSLAKISQINVLVLGHVKNPGRQTLTNMDSVLDALMAAGGIDKTGTLRQIRLVRGGKTMLIDLYGLLVYGSDGIDISLRSDDKIIIQPVGPTLAVSGDVKRPGIYEILPALKANWDKPEEKSQKLSMNDLLGLTGGVLSPAAHRFLRMDITDKGTEYIEEVSDPSARIFSDGDILNIVRGKEKREGTVELTGNANQSGIHALADAETLSDLLYDDSVIGPETYPLIGIIEHWNKSSMSKKLTAFMPKTVLNGEDDQKLEDGDKVYLFSQEQIENLGKPDPQALLIEASLGANEPENKTTAIPQNLRQFLIERSVFVRGAVREPGSYPVAEGADLESVLSVAGGASLEGNTRDIEVTSAPTKGSRSERKTYDIASIDPHTIRLTAGDTIRVNQKFRRVEDNHVLLIGEIKNPGTFDLQPGDTLGKLLARAGGITDDAYPDGTIFSRESERKREEMRFKSQAQDLELRLGNMLSQKDEDKKPDPEAITTARQLISQLKQTEALGRITVEADPAMLNSQPQLDILLESGDRIYIPKRPLTVRVAGEVLSPAALQFRSEKKPRDYLNEAGGMSYNADEERAFVVYPDGSAQPLAVSAWNHNAVFVPPGSTIVVPRDPKPLSFIDGAKDISQILANVATAAIFADDIRNDR